MIEIDGPLWFLGALIICGGHVLYLRSWRREQQQYQAWWQRHDVKAQHRHDAIMRAMEREGVRDLEWNLDGRDKRGQA